MGITFLGLGIILVLIAGNTYLFSVFSDTTYFEWYIEGGSIISLSIAFITLVVNDLDKNKKLVSANPAVFLSGCFDVLAIVYFSIAGNFQRALAPADEKVSRPSAFRLIWDSYLSIAIARLLQLVTLVWLLAVAPLTYLVYLVAGAPARLGLLNPDLIALLKSENRKKVLTLVDADQYEPDDFTMDVSLARKPVRLTATIAAILLWLVEVVVDLLNGGAVV